MNDVVASSAGDVRPIVRQSSNNRAVWIFGGALGLIAIGLFSSLEARRSAITSPSISGTDVPGAARITAPSELDVPPELGPYEYPPREQGMGPAPTALRQVPIQHAGQVPRTERVDRRNAPSYTALVNPPPFLSQDPGRALSNADAFPAGSGNTEKDEGSKDERVSARRLRNPSTTVPQGAVMQAVLETALDSSRPGFARAIISRDVSSFDGTRVLVPKGSKLFGEYQADVGQGQNRALIRWRRLTRPDGVIIDVDSPSADPLGRAGVKGKVNSHFFERFSGAILQSALDVGVQLAARKASRDTYVLAIPNGAQVVNPVKPDEIKPTVTVRQGASVSVFIARDLDFTDVGG